MALALLLTDGMQGCEQACEERHRLLMIDQDRSRVQDVALACLARGITVAFADTVCEGVRVLASSRVSAVLVDTALLRLTASEHAALFDHVAPGVPVVMAVGPETPVAVQVSLAEMGFRVLPHPVGLEDMLGAAAAHVPAPPSLVGERT